MSSRKSQRTGRGSPSRERASSPGGFRWFFPSFHGDLRLETEGDGTVLKIVKPTPREVEIVNAIGAEAQAKKWLDDWTPFVASGDDMVTFTLRAPVDEVGAVVIKHKAPGLDTLTAIYSHPTSGNIRWADVESLLGAVGTITEKHDGKFLVKVGAETETIERPKSKDVDVQLIVDLRRMLRNAGYEPQQPGTEV